MKMTLSLKGGTISVTNGVWVCKPPILNTQLVKAQDSVNGDMGTIDELIKMGAKVVSFDKPKTVPGRVY